MTTTKINGYEIYYEIEGSGDVVVLLHHGFGCGKIWDEDVKPGLLENGYRVLVYDRRGYGRSEAGPDFMDFYISDNFVPAAADELEALLDFLNIDSAHLVGQCEGGVVGMTFAATRPKRVKTSVAASTLCYSQITMVEFNRIKFTKKFKELEEPIKNKMIKWHGPDRAEVYFNQFAYQGGAYGCGVFDLRPTLDRVQCPALVLYPDRSFLFEVEQAVMFYRHLKEGELAVIPHCGHNTYEQAPDDYVQQVLSFLERQGY